MSVSRPSSLLVPVFVVLVFMAFFCLASSPAASQEAAPPEAAAHEPPPAGWELHGDAAAGREDFAHKCAVCHGESGDGHGRLKIEPPPRDLRNAEYMETRTDWQLYLAIRDGGPAVGMSRQMIAWSSLLSEQEMHDVTAYVRSLSDAAAVTEEEEPGEGGEP